MSTVTRILGIDPGLRTTGFGVIEREGARLHYVASGTIKTIHLESRELPARLKVLFDGVREVVQRYQPDAASVEIVFVNVNPQATLLLGQARGACVTALVSSDLAVAEYTALQMKKAVAGHGKAAKAQVQEMVMRLLKLPGLLVQRSYLVCEFTELPVEGRKEFFRSSTREAGLPCGGQI